MTPLRPIRTGLAAALICLALPAPAQDDSQLSAVTVVRPEPHEFVEQVSVSGTTVPRQEVLVYPQVAGYPITELPADIGDVVKKGDLLARLDSRTLEANLRQAQAEQTRAEAQIRQAESQIEGAKAAAQQAQAELKRQQGLRARGAVSESALEQANSAALQAGSTLASAEEGLAVANAALELAKSQVLVAQLNLDYATISAPVDGVISERNGAIGSIAAAAGDPLFRIVAGGDIELEAEVLETDLGRLSAGQEATLRIAGVGAEPGTVRLVSPRVDPATRLGLVRIDVEGQGLRTGLFGSGSVVIDRRQGVAVPATAIQTDEDGDFVLVAAEDGTLERRDVVAGLIEDDLREVAKGLTADDRVVARAGAFFRPGDRIRPVEDAAAESAAREPGQ